jgi:peptidyl-prolyl cis-trans isomerase C
MSITVNSAEIPATAVHAEMQYHQAESLAAAQHEAGISLVVRELLNQEVARLAIPGGSEEERIQALLDREIQVPKPDDATCHRYFANNPRKFRSADFYEAQHILFAAAPGDADARAIARDRAVETIRQLQVAPEQFEALARDRSDCPSKAMGGNLGQVARGTTVPEFETFLCNLEDGQLCPIPVETRYGFHVLRLHRHQPGRELPFDLIRETISEYLSECANRQAIRQYIQILAGRAAITGIELRGADSPLVQ